MASTQQTTTAAVTTATITTAAPTPSAIGSTALRLSRRLFTSKASRQRRPIMRPSIHTNQFLTETEFMCTQEFLEDMPPAKTLTGEDLAADVHTVVARIEQLYGAIGDWYFLLPRTAATIQSDIGHHAKDVMKDLYRQIIAESDERTTPSQRHLSVRTRAQKRLEQDTEHALLSLEKLRNDAYDIMYEAHGVLHPEDAEDETDADTYGPIDGYLRRRSVDKDGNPMTPAEMIHLSDEEATPQQESVYESRNKWTSSRKRQRLVEDDDDPSLGDCAGGREKRRRIEVVWSREEDKREASVKLAVEAVERAEGIY